MNWYLAKLHFQLIGATNPLPVPWDEQWCLIPAVTSTEALDKAHHLGRRQQDCFLDQQRKWVHHQFVRVVELRLMGHVFGGIQWHTSATAAHTQVRPTSRILTLSPIPTTRLMLHQVAYTLIRLLVLTYYRVARMPLFRGVKG